MDTQQPNTQGIIPQKVIVETAAQYVQTNNKDYEEDTIDTLEENQDQETEQLQLAQIYKNFEIIKWLVYSGYLKKALEKSREIYKYCFNKSDNLEYNDIKDEVKVIIIELEKRTTLNPEAPEFVPSQLQVNCDDTDITGESSNAHFDKVLATEVK